MTNLNPCPTPWCDNNTIHTTTFHKSQKLDDGSTYEYIEVEYSCPRCHVRTPQLAPEVATLLWNSNAAVAA